MTDRRLSPLFEPEHEAPPKASCLELRKCDPLIAREFIMAWHSRLPNVQAGPWILGYIAHYQETCFGAALWHNPSARTLPDDWLELRRLAIPEDAPACSASWMLGKMRKHIAQTMPDVTHLISYQDTEVHTGTIYKAANWKAESYQAPRCRDRSGVRAGTRRAYRTSINGAAPDVAGKVRWGIDP